MLFCDYSSSCPQAVCVILSIRDPESLKTSSLSCKPTTVSIKCERFVRDLLKHILLKSPQNPSFSHCQKRLFWGEEGVTVQAMELKSLRQLQFMCFEETSQ